MDFYQAFLRIIGHEGKLSLDKGDRGNWTSGIVGEGELKGTKYGISAMSYPHLDIRNLTLAQAKDIYYEDFWLRLKGDAFHPALTYQLFDTAVNSGPGNAIRILQRAVGVADDGRIGPITIDNVKVRSVNDVLKLFLAERLLFMTTISTWNLYGKGWARRIAENLKYAAGDYNAPWYERVEVEK